VHSSVVLKQFDWQPIVLQSKKDCLLNGTQFMSAYGDSYFNKVNKFSYLEFRNYFIEGF
jgi:histidine ammonia-lyase